jgi:DNA-binding response OmpR family regulator
VKLPFFKSKPRVLLLDDDASIRRLVSALLRGSGFRVDEVTSGRDALAIMEREDYAVLILDLMMPHEGGVTVMRQLRETDAAQLRRVVLLTAAPPSVVASYAHEVGAIVQKPFNAEELVATIARVAS